MTVLKRGSAEEAGFSEKQLQRVRQLVEGWCGEDLPYAIWMAASRGIIVGDESVGIASNRIFPVASITKVFTTTAAMILADEGRLSPIRRVSEYIPEFLGEGKQNVLVFHLMTHTSGLEDSAVYEHIEKTRETAVLPECPDTQHPSIFENLALGYESPLQTKPGTNMSYCNWGFELLGEIVRRVSGQSLASFIQERIFDPLGMLDSSFAFPEEAASRVLQIPEGYLFSGLTKYARTAVPSAAGGVFSTAYDLAKFGQTFLNEGTYNGNRILSEAAVQAMTRNQIPGVSSFYGEQVFTEAGWGLGWILSGDKRDESGTLRSPRTYWHTGAGCSMLLIDPDHEIVLTSFIPTKQYTGYFDRLFDRLTDAVVAGVVRRGRMP